ncbi:Ig-like domain-containing protein [Bacillus sp. V5-8f]|uniref:Ig-like domain-containing protein n=1 Tax=Bacillus sp. V5-8f TaxID=2053044 RepID=UPI000C763228|nr:Ig-like domain-containing protein [Bacillus sp. V5-8f]PLT35773.1 hypothetical protein CUU64_00410 [Bacillus sp. V5-8f]
MNKKKAIKIATASAIAASGFVAAAPAQNTEAAQLSAVDREVSRALTVMYNAMYSYSKPYVADGTLVDRSVVYAAYKKGEAQYKYAVAYVNKNEKNASKKAAALAKLAQVRQSHLLGRALNYIKSFNALELQVEKAAAKAEATIAAAQSRSQVQAAQAELKKVYDAQQKDLRAVIESGIEETIVGSAKAAFDAANEAATKKIAELPELAITSVSALDAANKNLVINFNQKVSGVQASDIVIKNSKSGAQFGVKEVKLASDGKSAQIELFAHDDANRDNPVLAYATDYSVTVTVAGEVVVGKFVRPAYLDEDRLARVVDVDSEKRTATIEYNDGDSDNGSPDYVRLDVPTTSDFNFQEALGQVIRVWFDGEENLVKYEYDTEKVVYDAIKVNKNDEIETIDEEVEYDLAANVQVIINEGSSATGSRAEVKLVGHNNNATTGTSGVASIVGKEYDYAKLIFNDSGDVERIYAYNNTDNPILVKQVEGNYALGYDSDELDLEDYVIVNAEGKQISIKDVKPNDLLFFNADAYSKDGFAYVLDNNAKGKIEDVFEDSFDFNGKNYDYTNAYGPVKYLNEDGDFENLTDTEAEQLQAGGDVSLYFDAKGELIYVVGNVADVDTNADSLYLQDKFFGYIDAKGDFQAEFDGLNSKGEEETYDFAIDSLDKITIQTAADEVEYEVDDNFPGNAAQEIDEFIYASAFTGPTTFTKATSNANARFIVAVNEAGTYGELVADLQDYATPVFVDANGDGVDDTNDATEQTNNVIKVNKDSNNKVNELTFITSAATLTTSIDEDDKYANGHKLQDSTLVYDVSRADKFFDPDADDVEVTTWGQLKKEGVDILAGQAKVYYNEDGEVTHLVTYNDSVADDQELTALITSVSKSDGDIVRISALVNGVKKTYEVKDSNADSVVEGSVAIIKVNEAGTIVTDLQFASNTARFVTGEVTNLNVGEGEITVNGVVYELGTDGEVYDATDRDGDDYTVEGGLRDVEVGDSVVLGLSATGSKFVDVVALVQSANYAPTLTSAVYDANGTANGTITLTFSEKIDDSELAAITPGTYVLTGSAVDAGQVVATVATGTADDNKLVLNLSADLATTGSVTVSIDANKIKDLAGKANTSTSATDTNVAQ